MSIVLITGGTGMFGSRCAQLLREHGHEVRLLSRRGGEGRWRGDLETGEGIAAAAEGAELVLHAASDARKRGKPDLKQTENLLKHTAGVRHLLYVSIVGIDRIPLGYYKNKLACEHAIIAAGLPHTIFRATQFHQLLEYALRTSSRFPLAPLPLEFKFQPIAAAEASERAAELLEGEPLGRAPDFGGPEVLTAREIVAAWRENHPRPRRVLNLPVPGAVARGFRAGLNTCPEHADGRQTWAEYAAQAS